VFHFSSTVHIDTLDKVRNERPILTYKPDIQNEPISTGSAGEALPAPPSRTGSKPIRPISAPISTGSVGGGSRQTDINSSGQPALPARPDSNDVDLGPVSGTEAAPPAGGGGLNTSESGLGSGDLEGQKPGGISLNTGGESGIQPGGRAASPARTDNGTAVGPVKKLDENVIFEPYTPVNVPFDGAQKHPASVVESSTMSAVNPPKVNYIPDIPERLVKSRISFGSGVYKWKENEKMTELRLC
jgi:hypothetical protein